MSCCFWAWGSCFSFLFLFCFKEGGQLTLGGAIHLYWGLLQCHCKALRTHPGGDGGTCENLGSFRSSCANKRALSWCIRHSRPRTEPTPHKWGDGQRSQPAAPGLPPANEESRAESDRLCRTTERGLAKEHVLCTCSQTACQQEGFTCWAPLSRRRPHPGAGATAVDRGGRAPASEGPTPSGEKQAAYTPTSF